ncbi:MAG: glutathione S-transferase family protein [Pseudomonadota bacterium]
MANYRLFGAETSPYSEKVRAALRYKGVDFDWVPRSVKTEADFQALAKVPTVPLLISPDAVASQDSTAMLASLELDHPEPSTVPDDPACAALSLILEDYGDEWLNKAMFNERWGQSPDQDAAAQRLLEQLFAGHPPAARAEETAKIVDRMAGRLPLVGAGGSNGDILRGSFHTFTELLDAHLKETLYIFGGRPSAADFSLGAQYRQMLSDPTPGEWLRDRAPFVTEWCEMMNSPKANDGFKPLNELRETLLPIFKDDVSKTYLVWSSANSENASKRRKKLSVKINGKTFEQDTQKYAAKAFKSVKKAIEKMKSPEGLDAFLKDAGMAKLLG